MKAFTPIAFAASLLLAGATVASAAANPGVSAAKTGDTAGGAAAPTSLSLSGAQQKEAYKDLYMPSLDQSAPAGFSAAVGATVPNSVATAPVTARAARDVPALKPYGFADLQHAVVIVNRSTDRIVGVISG